MDDNKQKNPWDELIEDLGAQPDENAFERHQPTPQEIPPTIDWEQAEELAADAKTQPSDWNSLAESLGLEVPEPAEESIEEPTSRKIESAPDAEIEQKATQPASEALASEVDEDEEQTPFGGELAPQRSLFDTEEEEATAAAAEENEAAVVEDELPPLPSQMDQALSDTTWQEDSAESNTSAEPQSAEDADLDSSGISGEAARSAFDALFSDGASSWGSAFLEPSKREKKFAETSSDLAADLFDTEKADELDAKKFEDAEGDDEGEKPKRKRSRRRRRGGKGRKSATEQTNETADSDEQLDEDRDELDDELATTETRKPKRRRARKRSRAADDSGDDAHEQNGEDRDQSESGREGDAPRSAKRGRQRHRNIPTWSEAISMIVDSNLDQRAKSPSKPQSSRGRGGRGGRRRKKSEK